MDADVNEHGSNAGRLSAVRVCGKRAGSDSCIPPFAMRLLRMGHPSFRGCDRGWNRKGGAPGDETASMEHPFVDEIGLRCGPPAHPHQRSKNLSRNSSQVPSSPGNRDPAVIPMTLSSFMTSGLSILGRSMILKNFISGLSFDRM